MVWKVWRLVDEISFEPKYPDWPNRARGHFVVHAETRRHAEICARLHLSINVYSCGFMKEADSPDLAE